MLPIAEPLMIYPDKQILTLYPDLERTARQLSLQYAHDHVVAQENLQLIGAALWQALKIDENFVHAKQPPVNTFYPL